MSAPATPIRHHDIYAPKQNGVYGNVFGGSASDIQDFIAGDAIRQRIALNAPASNTTQRLLDYVDPTGATVEMAIGGVSSGRVFTPATGGTFALTYNGSGTNLTVLAYDISAAALKSALESNTTFNPGGNTVTVTVTKLATGLYRIAWDQVGVRFLLAGDGTNLTPGSTVTASRVVTGSASIKEVQIIRGLQRPYAYNATWIALDVAAASVTQLQTGSSTLPSIQRVTLDPEPYDGTVTVTFGKAQVVRVICKDNAGAAKEKSTVQTVADVSSSLGGLYFDVYDNAGPVRVWIDVANASTAPAVPAGGRLLEVDISADAAASAVATAVKTAVDADAQFVATNSSNLVVITQADYGTRTDIAAGTSTFTVSTTTQGARGRLDDTYFVLYDDHDNSVAVWLYTDATTPASGVTDQSRYISVAIGATDNASTIGGLIATAVTADPDFTASNSSGVVTITNAADGVRTAATAGTSTFGVSVSDDGITMSPVIAWNAAEQDLQLAIDPDAEVITITKSGPFSWDFKFVENGSRSALAADVTGLKVPIGLDGTLSLATDQMLAASVANSFGPFDALYEIVVTFPGSTPWTFYQELVTIKPRLIDFSTTAPNPVLGDYVFPADLTVLGDLNVEGTGTMQIGGNGSYVTFGGAGGEIQFGQSTSTAVCFGSSSDAGISFQERLNSTSSFGTGILHQIDGKVTTSDNGDVLSALEIRLTPSNAGAYTGVGFAALRIPSVAFFSGASADRYGILIADVSGATTNYAISTGTGLVQFGGPVVLTPNPMTGAGAVSIATGTTAYTTAGVADALTLANGVAGQIKTIVLDVLTSGGHTAILTPTTKTGFTTVTFAVAGDTVTLQYFTTRGWMVLSSKGAVVA